MRRSLNRPPQWPFRLNQHSPQAQGLLAWWPGPVGIFPPELSNYGSNDAIAWSGTSAPAVSPHPLGGLAFDFDTNRAIRGTLGRLGDLTTLSLSMWAVPRSTAFQRYVCIGADAVGDDGHSLEIRLENSKWAIELFDGVGGEDKISDTTNVTLGNVYHVCGTRILNSTVRNFVNGREVNSGTDAEGTDAATSAGYMTIAGRYNPTTQRADGLIWDVRIYDRALPASTVAQMYDPATRWDLYAPRRTFVAVPAAAGAILAQTKTRVYTPGTYLG